MQKSMFQFSNPCLRNLEFIVNPEYIKSDEPIEIGIGLHINIERDGDSEAIVELTVNLGAKGDKAPFYISAIEGARFKWETEELDDNAVDKMLNQNAPALLLGYIRPLVATLTSASKYKAYNIPFINFTDENVKSKEIEESEK